MNIPLHILAVIGLLLAACAPALSATPGATTAATEQALVGVTDIVPPATSIDVTVPSTLEPTAVPTSTPEPTPLAALDFAAVPGNVATGDPAPDFSARTLGSGEFVLSEQRGSYVLVIPTVVGCGDCILTLQEIAKAYSNYRGQGLQVMMLNLYPEDTPEAWQEYVEFMGEPDFLWGVVNSLDFVIQYSITNPGTLLLVDREGRLVFRSEWPIQADDFRLLFDLATR